MSYFTRIVACLFALGLIVGVMAAWPREKWFVIPALDWKWKSCLTRYEFGCVLTGCGSPMSYDEALWWSETKGGKEFSK